MSAAWIIGHEVKAVNISRALARNQIDDHLQRADLVTVPHTPAQPHHLEGPHLRLRLGLWAPAPRHYDRAILSALTLCRKSRMRPPSEKSAQEKSTLSCVIARDNWN
jgi:hypothetical protein